MIVITPDPAAVIAKYYRPGSLAYDILTVHSEMVAAKALQLALRVKQLSPDRAFIREAALLHDIGIFLTDAPDIGCFGKHPYIMHGILGREILEKEGLPRHALVCERHTGTGISREDIVSQKLPLPLRDMRPVSLEEQLICYADKFYSKNPQKLRIEKPVEKIRAKLARFGEDKVQQFERWVEQFGT